MFLQPCAADRHHGVFAKMRRSLPADDPDRARLRLKSGETEPHIGTLALFEARYTAFQA